MLMKSKVLWCLWVLLLASTSPCLAEPSEQQTNKEKVIQFYQKAINEKNFEAAEVYLGDRYIQHNPMAADGKEGLKKFIGFLKTKAPQYHSEIKKAFADQDYVILHVHNTPEPGARGKAIVDIFRLEKGKIVEHWDVIQEIPEKSANANGMF
jgi:predicted SnoaL-like aldol condensation-catalyzing enzyme